MVTKTKKELVKLNVAELRHVCEERELERTGTERKLQNRLSEYLKRREIAVQWQYIAA